VYHAWVEEGKVEGFSVKSPTQEGEDGESKSTLDLGIMDEEEEEEEEEDGGE